MGEKIKNLKLYQGFVQMKETMASMTFKERLQHLFFSYKAEMYIAALLIFVVVFVISCISTANTELMIAGDLMNLSISDEGLEYLTNDYLERLGGEKFLKKFQIVETYYSTGYSSEELEYNYQSSSQIVARVAAGMLDFQIINKPAMELFLGEDFYLDLREFLTEEELAQWEGKIVYIEYLDSDERIPVALDISDTDFAKDCMPNYGPYFFAVIKTSPRLQETRDFFEYLLAWEENKAAASPAA